MIQSHSALLHPPPWGCTGGVPARTDTGLSRCVGARQTSPKLGDAAVLGLLEPPPLVAFQGSARHGGAPGLVPELTGQMGAIAGLGTQTVLNASGSESVAKGCRLLASESPRQGYGKAQGVTLAGTTCPQDLWPSCRLSSMRTNACRRCWGLLGARAPSVQAATASSGWAVGQHRAPLLFPVQWRLATAFGEESENCIGAGEEGWGLWGKEPPPQPAQL